MRNIIVRMPAAAKNAAILSVKKKKVKIPLMLAPKQI